jgi:hypothetical protein
MRVILGGQFENSLLRELSADAGMPSGHATSHPYYMGIYRPVSPSIFERSGTFLAIANTTAIPEIDWSLKQIGTKSGIDEAALGLTTTTDGGREWDDDCRALAAVALTMGAFSSRSKEILTQVPPPVPLPSEWRVPAMDVNPFGEVNYFALHHLCRLLLHIRASREHRTFLVLSDDDQFVLRELVEFVLSNRIPTPYDLPDFRTDQVLAGERYVAGLLNFAPPDGESIAAVRADPRVQRYAELVRTHIMSDKGEEGLLMAMRDAMEEKKQTQKVRKVFEVSSWVMKPLGYIPFVGEIVSAFSDLRDVLAKWMERKQSDEEWYLLGPKMQDITVEEYLSRKSNL